MFMVTDRGLYVHFMPPSMADRSPSVRQPRRWPAAPAILKAFSDPELETLAGVRAPQLNVHRQHSFSRSRGPGATCWSEDRSFSTHGVICKPARDVIRPKLSVRDIQRR